MPTEATIRRNINLDIIKGISCFLVVFYHCPIPGKFGELLIYAFRFPVPCFAMITGFFLYRADGGRLLKQSRHLLFLILGSEVFYGVYRLIRFFVLKEGEGISDWFWSLDVTSRPLKVLLNGTLFCGPLWYLYASFWTLLLIYVLRKWRAFEKLWPFLIAGLLAVLVGGRYYYQNHFEDIQEKVWIFNNALFFILPMTLMGMELKKHEDKIRSFWTVRKASLLILAGCGLIVVEYLIHPKFMDFHISTFFISTGIMLLALTAKARTGKPWLLLAGVGRNLSVWIYILHPFFAGVFSIAGELTGRSESGLFAWIRVVMTLVLTTLTALLLYKLQARCKRRGKSQW